MQCTHAENIHKFTASGCGETRLSIRFICPISAFCGCVCVCTVMLSLTRRSIQTKLHRRTCIHMLASNKHTHNAKRKFNYTLGYMLIETCRCVCVFFAPARAQLKLVFVVASFEFSCTPDCHLSLSLSLSPRNFLRGKRGCAHTKEVTAASGREK